MNDVPIVSFIEALGWMLLHFVWQGTAVARALWLFLYSARNSSAQLRYGAGCAALLCMLIGALATFVGSFDYYRGPESQITSNASTQVETSSSGSSISTRNSPVVPPIKSKTPETFYLPTAEPRAAVFMAIASWLRPWMS